MSAPTPPSHLSRRSKAFWRSIVADYDLPVEHLEVLRKALEASDRVDQAGELLREEGLVVTDKYGQVKPHPASSIETANRRQFLQLIEALKLGDDEASGAVSHSASALAKARWAR